MAFNRFYLPLWALCLALFVTTSNSFANNSVCNHTITFLPQVHRIDSGFHNIQLTDSDKFKVADSQLRILKYLEKEKLVVVFSEEKIDSLLKNIVKKRTSGEITVTQYEALLALLGISPKGIADFPVSSKDLNTAHTKALVDYGAIKIAILNQLIDVSHPVIQDKDIDRVFGVIKEFVNSDAYNTATKYPPKIAQLVYEERERLALTEINTYFRNHPDVKDIVLIFGGNHNFTFYPDLFPLECIIVPEEFQSYWHGKNRSGPLGF